MITQFKIFEGIRWWRDGKLGEEELDNDDGFKYDMIFEVGDTVESNIGCFYWNDVRGVGDINLQGSWSSYKLSKRKITHVDYCEDKEGYTGQIVKLKSSWPWYQITNLIKV